MFNGGNTEVLLIHFKYMNLEPFPTLKICNDFDHTSLSARNLGVFWDECVTMEKQVSAVPQWGFFHLRNIAISKCYLTEMSLLIIAQAFITNKMDYCNSLLFGLSNTLLYKHQHLHNSMCKTDNW